MHLCIPTSQLLRTYGIPSILMIIMHGWSLIQLLYSAVIARVYAAAVWLSKWIISAHCTGLFSIPMVVVTHV